jgi:hypothetical protein
MYFPADEESVGPHHNKKKNTKKWCKGKVGKEHVPHITRSNYGRLSKCQPAPWRVVGRYGETMPIKRYICWHQRSCQNCGKVIEYWLPAEECPDYKETDD